MRKRDTQRVPPAKRPLSWKRLDPEAHWGLPAKKFTAVSNVVSFGLGLLLTGLFYAALYPLHLEHRWQTVEMFFHGGAADRSCIPYFTVFLSCWCLAFLWLKYRKLRVQRRALTVELTPDDPEGVVSPLNAQEILSALQGTVNRCEDFMVLWRVERALANLRNIGRVADVSSLLNDLAETDTDYVENSYTLPKGMIWAIPVLGFIGTVLGLSQAVGGFGAVVAGGADLEALKGALGRVTGGLATAFETTLIALVAALLIQLLMTILVQKEEEFLDDCSAFCHAQLTSRLKMQSFSDALEEAGAGV